MQINPGNAASPAVKTSSSSSSELVRLEKRQEELKRQLEELTSDKSADEKTRLEQQRVIQQELQAVQQRIAQLKAEQGQSSQDSQKNTQQAPQGSGSNNTGANIDEWV
ncbi:FlxA-like family protein [Laribacter hongkongensis]|uniref:FlxA-like family protein n=1 Tax=Laribacter hongkongensis TaxID=168471 RepID=UPI001EFCED5A|nr:FlxA-like family protein [Laribacter hongkongensis]MCG9075582.1 FlxA-like family protein [Laribacter hongkongensis]